MRIPLSVFFVVALLLHLLSSCIPPEPPVREGVVLDLSDPLSQHIRDLENERNVDSLVHYLRSDNASQRYLAARGLANFPTVADSTQDRLIALLRDPDDDVRTVAAYALGQIGDGRTADSLAAAFDTLGRARAFNAAVLAAVGKTGTEQHLRQITNITTYRITDTLLTAGQAWSLFYFARRQLSSSAGAQRMIALLLDEQAAPEIRLPAAHYLQRFPVQLQANQKERLLTLLRKEENEEFLPGILHTLGREKSVEARIALIRTLRSAASWRVRVEAIKALQQYDYVSVREPVVEQLQDEHPLVRQTAADFLLQYGSATDATFYYQLARDSARSDIRFTLYAAANRHLPPAFTDYRGRINYDLQQTYARTDDVFTQRAILAALGEFPWNYRIIYELYQKGQHPAVRTAAAEALEAISKREDFAAFFRSSNRRARQDLAGFFREFITRLEVGPAYAAANALRAHAEVYRPLLPNPVWLEVSLRTYPLPRAVEAYRAIAAAQATLLEQPIPTPLPLRAPAPDIDWKRLLRNREAEVEIRTTEGRIVLRLWPELAPATVARFLQLVEEAYYDEKYFHRVVPNFVAQGGGPIGDGFGSEDFALRTETPPVRWDRAGLIGLASAGRDTESVQFFITHRPAPHLDGNYTAFGEVISGQEVADQLTIGSAIETISLR